MPARNLPVTPAERAALVARYRTGYAAVTAALADAGPGGLDASKEGGWTPRQVVHHLADAEMTGAIRLRRLLAEDAPAIAAYDEEAFATALRYAGRPVEAALRAIEASRATSAELLDDLGDEDWRRGGTHTEHGTWTVEDWLEIYAAHAHDHATQIRRAAGLG